MIYALVRSSWLGKDFLHRLSGTELQTFVLWYRKDIAAFFEPSVEAIADAFEKQRRAATRLKFQIKVRLTWIFCDFALLDRLIACIPGGRLCRQ